jgi:hypothetical protein
MSTEVSYRIRQGFQDTYPRQSTLDASASMEPVSEVTLGFYLSEGAFCAGFLPWPERFQLNFWTGWFFTLKCGEPGTGF